MNWRLDSLNRWLQMYDKSLFAKVSYGRVDVCRKVDSLHKALTVTEDQPPSSQYIFSLTDNWKITGTPVDRGHMPILHHLQWLDSWNDDRMFDKMKRNREREEENAARANRNEIRAQAYDMRREFAKATNDIRLGD